MPLPKTPALATDCVVVNIAKSTPLRAASTAEDVADAALFLISDAARHITGETLLVDAGMHLGFTPTTRR